MVRSSSAYARELAVKGGRVSIIVKGHFVQYCNTDTLTSFGVSHSQCQEFVVEKL
jgi:hypothetical protein